MPGRVSVQGCRVGLPYRDVGYGRGFGLGFGMGLGMGFGMGDRDTRSTYQYGLLVLGFVLRGLCWYRAQYYVVVPIST